MSSPVAVRTVALYVSDTNRSREFYENILDFPVDRVDAGRVQLRVGSTRLLLHPTDTDGRDRLEARHGRCEVYFEVQDVDGLVGRLRDLGVPVVQAPTDQPWGERDAIALDPDGFPVFLTQVLRDAD